MSKRKSFLIHIDSLDILDDLSDEQAGQLFKAIKSHRQGQDVELSPIVKIAFSPFKNQFARDDEKYEKLCEKNRLIAEKRYATKSTTGKTGDQAKPSVTKSTDNKNDSDSDSDSNSDNKELIVPAEPKPDKFTAEDMEIAKWIEDRILAINPKFKKKDLKKWADVIRLMREQDNRTKEEICAVFDWANKNSFWHKNILSPGKLRDKFDELVMQMGTINTPRPPERKLTQQEAKRRIRDFDCDFED